jgi:hypothetical protein
VKTICGDPDTLLPSSIDPIPALDLNAYFSEGGLHVDFQGQHPNGSLSLFDLNGRCIITWDAPSRIRFPVYLDIPTGVYVLRYSYYGRITHRKLVRAAY